MTQAESYSVTQSNSQRETWSLAFPRDVLKSYDGGTARSIAPLAWRSLISTSAQLLFVERLICGCQVPQVMSPVEFGKSRLEVIERSSARLDVLLLQTGRDSRYRKDRLTLGYGPSRRVALRLFLWMYISRSAWANSV